MIQVPAKYRKAVYVTAVVSVVVTAVLSVYAPEQLSEATEAVARVIALISSLLAIANVTPDS